MGNYISCTLAGPVSASSIRATKVIFPSGETRRLYERTKAAELMLDAPSSFLVSARSLQVGRRFAALSADDELEVGDVYVLFPMARRKSMVTAADMGALFVAANSAARRATRISPECGRDSTVADAPAPARLNLDDMEEFAAAEFRHRLSVCRSKKPLLETIVEEPICLR